MGKSLITEEIEKKIIKLKSENKKINNIIDIIFNEDNIKITKYGINKTLKKLQNEESNELSESNKSESNKSETNEETKEENTQTKNTIVNNSLIDKLNDSDDAETESEPEQQQPEQPPKKLFKVELEEPKIFIKPKNIVHDVIKNIDVCWNIDEMKEKRSLIIIIRQYIGTFKKELSELNINEKLLFNYDIMKLKILLENIRIELNLKKNSTLFIDTAKNILVGYEKVLCYSGIDIKGVSEELLNNPDFIYDLQMISCEIDISRYINPKTSAFMKVVQSSYYKYEQNNIINKFNEKINNDDVLNKLKNLTKQN